MSVYTPQHTCREDRVRKGYCSCGQKMPEGLKRNRELERDIIRNAAAGLMVDPEPLIVFANRRAEQGAIDYGFEFPSLDRDLAQETLDELGDAANYIAWFLDAIHRGLLDGGDRVTHLQRALRHVVLAFEETRSAR